MLCTKHQQHPFWYVCVSVCVCACMHACVCALNTCHTIRYANSRVMRQSEVGCEPYMHGSYNNTSLGGGGGGGVAKGKPCVQSIALMHEQRDCGTTPLSRTCSVQPLQVCALPHSCANLSYLISPIPSSSPNTPTVIS